MNADQIGRWLTLGANVGVIASIIFLALEIRQNSILAQMQFADDRRAAFQQGALALFGDTAAEVWEKSILDPASLSLAELKIMDAYLYFQLANSMRVFRQEEAGLLDEGATEAYMKANLPFYFNSKFAKAWWNVEGATWQEDFVQLADPIISNTRVDESVDKLRQIQNEATKE